MASSQAMAIAGRANGSRHCARIIASRWHKPAEDGIEPWLHLNKAAQFLHIAPKTLRLAAEAGEIHGSHPFPDGPWIFSRADLATSAAQTITERARQNPRHPTGSHPDQQSLFSSMT